MSVSFKPYPIVDNVPEVRLADSPDAPWITCASQADAAMMVGVNEGDLSNHLTQSIHGPEQRPGVDPVNGWLVRRPICEGEGAWGEGGGTRGVKRLRDGGGGGGDTDDACGG